MSSSTSSYIIDILSNIPIYLYRYVGIILYIIGNIGNLLTFWIFLQKSWRKNVCIFYYLICLISNTIFINSSLIGTIFIFGFNINLLNSNIIICKLFYYLAYVFASYYPIVLILASVDRLLISSQNVDRRLYSSKRLAYLSISVTTFIWSLFCIHILIKIHIQEIYPTVYICYYDLSKIYQDFDSYSVLIIGMSIFILMIVLSIFTFKNVRHIRPVPRQQRNQLRSMTKKDFQLLRSLYIHNISYIIFTTVFLISVCYKTAREYQIESTFAEALEGFLNNVGTFMHYIPYCTSFFIFIWISKAFRYEIKRRIYRICGKNIRTIRDEDNNKPETDRGNINSHHAAIVNTIT